MFGAQSYKNFLAAPDRSAGLSGPRSGPSVSYLRLLSSSAPSGAAFSSLLTFSPLSPPLRTWRGDTSPCAAPVRVCGPSALPPCPVMCSWVVCRDPDLLTLHKKQGHCPLSVSSSTESPTGCHCKELPAPLSQTPQPGREVLGSHCGGGVWGRGVLPWGNRWGDLG